MFFADPTSSTFTFVDDALYLSMLAESVFMAVTSPPFEYALAVEYGLNDDVLNSDDVVVRRRLLELLL